MSKLKNKVAVVTGASKGIGAAIAKALASEGASVVVNYSSSKEGADRVVADITAKGGKAVAVQGDVSKAKDVDRIFAETKKQFGTLDVLVNNAGVYEFSPIGEVTEDKFHRLFNTNVLGVLLASQQAANLFGPEGGSIINIGSVVSRITPPGSSIYSATKSAVDAVTGALARELGPKKSASTPSILAWLKPRACTPPASSAATLKKELSRKLPWVALPSQTTSRLWPSSSPPPIQAG